MTVKTQNEKLGQGVGNLNFEIGEAVIKQLIEISKGKTLIAVTHDERLGRYFDYTIDMNKMVGGDQNA